MGASGSKKFLEEPVSWTTYIDGGWRSERMQELDRLGGLNRNAIGRGNSFSAKLSFLEVSLKVQGDKMQETLTPLTPMEKADQDVSTAFQFHTAVRAAKRISNDGRHHSNAPAGRPSATAAAGRLLLMPDVPAASRREALLQHGLLRGRRSPAMEGPSDKVADWRLHMHQARRRLVLMVRTMILLRRQVRLAKRPARVDSLSFLVPLTLAEDKARFIKEVANYEVLKAEYERIKAFGSGDLATCVQGLLLEGAVERPRSRRSQGANKHTTPATPGAASEDGSASETYHPQWPREPSRGINALNAHSRSRSMQRRLSSEPNANEARNLLVNLTGNATSTSFTGPIGGGSASASSVSVGGGGNAGAGVGQRPNQGGPPRWSNRSMRHSDSMPVDVPGTRSRTMPLTQPAGNGATPRATSNRTISPDRPVMSARVRQSTLSAGGSTANSSPPDSSYSMESRPGSSRLQSEGRQLAAVRQSLHLLQMYINRYNTVWSESQRWECLGQPFELTELLRQSDHFALHKADVLRKLRDGQICLQLFCGEDYIKLGDGSWQDLWTADPWLLVDGCRPGMMPLTEHIEGVSLGVRILCQAVRQLTAVAGPEALAALLVILHVNDHQKQDVLDDLWAHNCLGLTRTNVLVMVQPRSPGFAFDQMAQSFVPAGEVDPEMGAGTHGSGWGLLQMQWAGEALVMEEDGSVGQLPGSVFELLAQRKVEWLLAHRSRDLSLLAPGDNIFSLPDLAHTLSLREREHASLITEMITSESPSLSRAYDSFLLLRRPPTPAASSPTSSSPASAAPAVTSPPSAASSACIIEMRHAELVPTRLSDGKYHDNSLAIGLQRYMLHVPTLKNVISSPSVFRPKLALNGQLVQVSLDIADLTACSKVRTTVVRARAHHGMLCSADDVDALVPWVQLQDKSPDFRSLLASCSGDGDRSCPLGDLRVVGGVRGLAPTGRVLLVCAIDNNVTLAAARMAAISARAGKDHIKLVTFVPSEYQISEGDAFLTRLSRETQKNTLADVLTETVVRGPLGLVDSIERYAETHQASIIFMGSNALTSGVSSVLVSSVTLAVVKRLATPVMVVTANSARQVAQFKTLRSMAIVEAHAKPMLEHMCQKLLDHKRGDRLILGQVLLTRHQTRQQIFNHRRLMDVFSHLAASLHQPTSHQVTLDGTFEKAIADGVEYHKVCLLGVQLPQSMRSIPQHIIALLRASKAAVLLIKGGGVAAAGRVSMASMESILGNRFEGQ